MCKSDLLLLCKWKLPCYILIQNFQNLFKKCKTKSALIPSFFYVKAAWPKSLGFICHSGLRYQPFRFRSLTDGIVPFWEPDLNGDTVMSQDILATGFPFKMACSKYSLQLFPKLTLQIERPKGESSAYYLLTGCKGCIRKYERKVFHTAQACKGCLENQGLVFTGMARAPQLVNSSLDDPC